jgi:hypothetical protein
VKRIVMLLTVAAVFAALMALNGLAAGTAFAVNTTSNQQNPPFGQSTGSTVHGSHGSIVLQHGKNGKVYSSTSCKVTGSSHTC